MSIFLYMVFFFCCIVVLFFVKTKIRASNRTTNPPQLDNTWFPKNSPSLTPTEYQRAGDQTFLTYPEWFLVFSPAEQAVYFQTKTATKFPYEQHVEQFWDSYTALSNEIEPYFPYNKQYHTMIKVIGYSTLIEYRGKLLYESSIGRLSDLIPSKATAEDVFYAAYTQRYVDFIKKEPWYLYSFLKEFRLLWTKTTCLEWNWIRKIERRFFISGELLFKAFYGFLLGLGTKSAYGVAAPVTAVIIDHLPTQLNSNDSEITLVKVLSSEATLITLPRYAAFNPALRTLINAGAQIQEIAGNCSTILLTIVVPIDWKQNTTFSKSIFKQTIATNNHQQRVALAVLVPNLSTVILKLEQEGIEIEHIFDY
ncbi:MAG: hypothetical protein JKY03_08485 [Aureispira sp.]|nr:hypothetical protein [Aureispira sp.]